ncbi:MAG: reverse transcriptase family protein [Chitinophagales bacterium]
MAQMTNNINKCRLVSYNMHGINQGLAYLEDLLQANDILCVQEHWLSDFNLSDLDNINSGFTVYSVSSCNSNVILRGRPHGGLAIFVSNSLSKWCTLIHKSSRFLIMRFCDILLINVYMPSNNPNLYLDVLTEISDCLLNYQNFNKVLVCGDFNYDFIRDSSSSCTPFLQSFLKTNNLVSTYTMLPDRGVNQFSYYNSALNQRSLIDHFFTTHNLLNNVHSLAVEDNGANLSDHIPVILNLNYNFNTVKTNATNPKSIVYKLRWDKSDLMTYYNYTRFYLQPIFDSLHMLQTVDSFAIASDSIEKAYSDIITALHLADRCITRKPTSFYKFWWDEELSQLKDNSINAHTLWQSAGKPITGNFHANMLRCKLLYKNAINQKRKADQSLFTNEMYENLSNKNMQNFWSSWRSNFYSKRKNASCIDGVSGNQEISNTFANYFRRNTVANNDIIHDGLKYSFEQSYINYQGQIGNFEVTIEDIDHAVLMLKTGKACGIDEISSEHIIYSHPILQSCLLRIFNAMLKFGYVPNSFGEGIIIPLLKNKDDPNKSDNYRCITLSPVISKLFEYCLMCKFSKYLYTSDLQFGFKPNVGCNDALFTLKNVIDYFVSKGNTVNISALDISKAFDRISQYGLYTKLIERNCPRSFIDVIKNWYSKCYGYVKWESDLSMPFPIQAGVRQGGILSPVLFAVYMDDLIKDLSCCKMGCHINGKFVGCILYADDILLLSISYSAMQNMLNICNDYAFKYDLKFNVLKSQFIRIGAKWKVICNNLYLNNQVLSKVEEIKYLGVYIKQGSSFKCSNVNTRIKFYRSFNAVYSKCKSDCPEIVVTNLLKYYCVPIITYGLEAINPSNNYLNSLDKLIDHACMKIFKTFDINIITEMRYIFNIPSVKVLTSQRKINMFQRFNDSKFYFRESILNSANLCKFLYK